MQQNQRLRVRARRPLQAVGRVETAPYPGFPTDAQPLLMAALLRAEGESLFRENIFENRFRHVDALRQMGARIRTEGREALVIGVDRLHPGVLEATDLRGGAAMILSGLQAEGETLIWDRGHLRRGYEDLPGALGALGAELIYEGESHGILSNTKAFRG